MRSLNKIIEEYSSSTQKLHTSSVEWQWLIIVSGLIKIATAVFSVFCGYHYISQNFEHIGYLLSVVFGIISIVIIETLNALLLGKGAKMVLNKKWVSGISLMFASLCIFFISFMVSTEGLASWQTSQPREKVASREKEIVMSYDNRVANFQKVVKTINADTWQGKISTAQEREVVRLSTLIENIEKEKVKAIEIERQRVADQQDKIESVVTFKAEKYYKVAAVVMAFQFVGNILFTFFLFLVNRENQGLNSEIEDLVKHNSIEVLTRLKTNYQNLTGWFYETVQVEEKKQMSQYAAMLAAANSINNQQTTHSTGTPPPPQPTQTQPSQRRSIGFAIGRNAPLNVALEGTLNANTNAFNMQANNELNADNSRVNNGGVNNAPAVRDNSGTRVGDTITCSNPECNNTFKKRNTEHRACCPTCRRKVWALLNNVPESFAFHRSNH